MRDVNENCKNLEKRKNVNAISVQTRGYVLVNSLFCFTGMQFNIFILNRCKSSHELLELHVEFRAIQYSAYPLACIVIIFNQSIRFDTTDDIYLKLKTIF